jgi:hypothetical protein
MEILSIKFGLSNRKIGKAKFAHSSMVWRVDFYRNAENAIFKGERS